MPLHWVPDPTAALAFSLAPPFSAPLFRTPAVEPLTLAPSFSRRFRRRRCSRTDLNGKSRCWLYLHLGVGRLYVNNASEQERGKRAECSLHDRSFRVVHPTL